MTAEKIFKSSEITRHFRLEVLCTPSGDFVFGDNAEVSLFFIRKAALAGIPTVLAGLSEEIPSFACVIRQMLIS